MSIWQSASAPPSLDGCFHVWRIRIPDVPTADSSRWLSAPEAARRDRFHRERDRARYATARAALRSLLSAYLGGGEVPIEPDAGGKPHVPGADLSFNVSHAGDWALIAFAHSTVGVDIEEVRPIHDFNSVGQIAFADAELAALAAAAPADRASVFYRTWVRKEAYLKLTGEGMGAAPRDIAILPIDERFAAVSKRNRVERIRTSDLVVAPSYLAAVMLDQDLDERLFTLVGSL